ncbi:mitogen-activated protein kinase [Jackrogersella minutella]|nr:mitogen-activated protein kinase [Jackrogersella minutella]
MATLPASSSSSVSNRPTFACVRCAERKVKCDRERPCSACVNHKVECVFRPPRPPRKRHQVLTDRLRHYETLLQEQGIDPRKLPYTPSSESEHNSSQAATVVPEEFRLQTSPVESEASGNVSKTQLIHGQGRYMFVDNSLWSRVVEEFPDLEDALENYSDDLSDSESSDDGFDFVLSSPPKSSARSRHPPPKLIHQLWQLFTENFDPLTKVVHVPTLRPLVQKVMSNVEGIPRGFEALMFAIYGAAVMSLSYDECKKRLGEPRKTLLARYTTATKAALSRARFMGTTSLIVLQALVIHLLSVHEIYEPRAAWTLTGVAVRIAQGMGLERDGVYLGLSPYETEVRRRIWWQLKSHDYRTAELCGLTKFRDLNTGPYSTKPPTNVNDDQLYPDMSSLPVESKSLTDIAFVSVRYEFANFTAGRVAKFRQEGKNSSQWDRDLASGGDKNEIDEAIREIEGLLEMKFLRYCDPSQPLHLMTMLMARSSINTLRFLTHHPRRWASMEQTPLSERQWVWEVSIKILEQYNMLQSNPQLKRFAWQAAFVMQWHAFIHVLDTLRANPLIADAEKAWELTGNIYKNNPVMVLNMSRPIHVAVGSLCLKAYSARVATLVQNRNLGPLPTPEFILQLRQQREVAKAKRQARDAKTSQCENPSVHVRPDAGVIYSSSTSESAHVHQSAMPHQPSDGQTAGGAIDGNPFWSMDGFDDSHFDSLSNLMDMNLDVELTQNCGVEDRAFQTITWEQWDTWIAESDAMPSLSSASDSGANIRFG